MKVLADPTTGELVEVANSDITPQGPYDYQQSKRVGLSLDSQRQQLIEEYEKALIESGQAEVEYRQALATEMVNAKADLGATMAEKAAKGSKLVTDAYSKRIKAEAREKATQELLRLSAENRATYHRHVEWSMQQERQNAA